MPAEAASREKELGHWARTFAENGWLVFPCEARGKAPLVKNGFKDATKDSPTIDSWWQRWPDANIGLALPEGVFVIDVDEPAAMQWFKDQDIDLPSTLTVKTGRGFHFYFWSDQSVAQTKIAPGIETRVNGRGYVLAPGSVHPNGHVYTVTNGRFRRDR